MHDSVEIAQGAPAQTGAWLLFIHHIPPKPDYFRVKVRRRLQRIGAVPLKNSVYVLPNTEDAAEDFQWLLRLIVDEGGSAMLCAAGFLEGISDREVERMFRDQSEQEYAELLATARAADDPTDADVRRLARQLDEVEARDYFGAPGGDVARRAVHDLTTPATSSASGPGVGARDARPHGATWVTRAGLHVDRIASAWLIRRFIDAAARFTYAPGRTHQPGPGELRFDMFDGEFTHEGDACTFEVLLARFGLDDPALQAIGEIVHDIDCKDDKFGRDEVPGVAALVRGIAAAHQKDDDRLAAGSAMFDTLFAALQRRRA